MVHEEIDTIAGALSVPHWSSATSEVALTSEAAPQLGWPVGTVKSRQARGRRICLLRDQADPTGAWPRHLHSMA